MNVIYTMAYLDEAWEHAPIMVDSVRRFGKFDGDIIIFGDRPAKIQGATVIENWDILGLQRIMMGKAYIGRTFDFSKYKNVMWLDADMLCVKPINDLFGSPDIRAAIECQVLREIDKDAFSIPAFPIALGHYGFNAGLILSPVPRWKTVCDAWMDCIIRSQTWNLHCCDQPALNHLHRSGVIHIEALPKGTVHFFLNHAEPVSGDTLFVHARAPLKLETMKCVWGIRTHAQEYDSQPTDRGDTIATRLLP